jgi:hypothetical protein
MLVVSKLILMTMLITVMVVTVVIVRYIMEILIANKMMTVWEKSKCLYLHSLARKMLMLTLSGRETKVEQIFDLYDYPIEKKAKLAAIEFKGYAITWWNQVRAEFRRVGQDYITWYDIKREMRHRFVPAYYSRELHLRLKRLV